MPVSYFKFFRLKISQQNKIVKINYNRVVLHNISFSVDLNNVTVVNICNNIKL